MNTLITVDAKGISGSDCRFTLKEHLNADGEFIGIKVIAGKVNGDCDVTRENVLRVLDFHLRVKKRNNLLYLNELNARAEGKNQPYDPFKTLAENIERSIRRPSDFYYLDKQALEEQTKAIELTEQYIKLVKDGAPLTFIFPVIRA